MQVRSEYLVFLLAVLCYFVPDVEERLREVLPGRGRQKTADEIAGSTNGFFLDASLAEASKKVRAAAGGGGRSHAVRAAPAAMPVSAPTCAACTLSARCVRC